MDRASDDTHSCLFISSFIRRGGLLHGLTKNSKLLLNKIKGSEEQVATDA